MNRLTEPGANDCDADCFGGSWKSLCQYHGVMLPDIRIGIGQRQEGKPMRRLYTRRGDLGETDLLGERVAKDDPRIDLIGELDETTSVLGLARSLSTSQRGNQILIDIQRDLYRVMADLAFVTDTRPPGYETSAEWVERIETLTDQLTAEVVLPRQFVLPGEIQASAALDVARAVVRRAERQAVHLYRMKVIANQHIVGYLNRLSSLLFVLARFVEAEQGAHAEQAKQSP
jgi:cob(I)alamin adenosyltransferase